MIFYKTRDEIPPMVCKYKIYIAVGDWMFGLWFNPNTKDRYGASSPFDVGIWFGSAELWVSGDWEDE